MTTFGYIALGLVAVVALIAWTQARAQSGTYRSLSSRMPRDANTQTPLGMEATDIDLVNRVTRRNESLERANTSLTNKEKMSRVRNSDLVVEAMPDDETYAKRFYAAFQRKDKGSNT